MEGKSIEELEVEIATLKAQLKEVNEKYQNLAEKAKRIADKYNKLGATIQFAASAVNEEIILL